MNQEIRALLAGVLSLAVFLGWYYFFAPAPVPSPAQRTTPVSSPEKTPSTVPVEITEGKSEVGSLASFENSLARWETTSANARLTKIVLKQYHETIEEDAPSIQLVSENGIPLSIHCESCTFPLPTHYSLASDRGGEITYRAENDQVQIEKVYLFPKDETYPFSLKVRLKNKTREPLSGRLGIFWKEVQKSEKKNGGLFSFLKGPADTRSFVYQQAGKMQHAGKKGGEALEITGPIAWAGIEDRYFLTAVITRRLSSEASLKVVRRPDSVEMTLWGSPASIPGQGVMEESYAIYAGPKDRQILGKIGVGLEKTVDYGFLSFFAIPILKLLLLFHSFIHNWGVAIILMTFVVKLLLNPLSIKSLGQMKEMQKLQPRLKEIKEKYKEDKQRLNMETMQLFKTHKVNPLGGCLPMLVQMPIYIALYKVLYNSIEIYHAPFFGFYRDLSAPDPYMILPILLGVFMVLQQKLTPNTSADPTQRQMMMIMPVMFTAFMLFLPLGLVLYILVNTVMTVVQQYMHQKDIRWRDLARGRWVKSTP